MIPNTVAPAQGDQGQMVITPQTFSSPPEKGPVAPAAPAAPMGVAAASEAARALIAATGSALPAEANPTRELPAQPRASDGTFGQPLPAAPASPNAAPEAGQAPPAEGAPAVEGEGTPEEIAPEIAAQTVTLDVNGEPLDLNVGDPAIAEVIRTQIETAREADTIRAEAERTIEEVTAIREHVQIDPVGFVLRELRESPAGQEHLLLSLLTQPAVFERLKPQIEGMLSDPQRLELVRAQQQAARAQFAQQARHEVEEGRAVQQNVRDVQAACAAIARMLPNEAAQPTAYNDFLRDLMAYADTANVTTIAPEHIPVILANRLAALGLNPVEAATQAAAGRANGKNGKAGNATPPRATAIATPRPVGVPMPPAPRSAPNGQQFVAAQQRRSASVIPSGGVGSPSAGPDLVMPTKADGTPMGIAEATAWHRQQVNLGKRGAVPLTR